MLFSDAALSELEHGGGHTPDAALSELEHGGGHTPTGAGSHSQVLERGVLYLLRSCWSRSTFKFVQGASRQIQVVI